MLSTKSKVQSGDSRQPGSVRGRPKHRMDDLMSSYRHLDPFHSQEYHGHTGYVWGCAMTSDNGFLFSGSDDKLIKVWSTSTNSFLYDLEGHTDCAYFLIMTKNDEFLISAGWDQKIIIWDWRNRAIHKTNTGHTNEIFYLVLTLNEQYLISGSRDMSVKVWNFAGDLELIADFSYGNSVFGIAITNDNKEIIATGFAETIKIFSLESKSELSTFSPGIGPIQCLAMTPNNKYLAFGSRTGKFLIWNYSDKTEYCSFNSHENSLRNIACTSDNNYVISSSLDKTVRIFNLKLKVEEVKLIGCGGWIYGIFLSVDNQFLLAGSTDKIMRMWKIGDKLRVKVIQGHPQAVSSVAVSRDGNIIATTCADKVVRKWNREDGTLVLQMYGHTDALWTITISYDMNYIISAGADKVIILWNYNTGEIVGQLIGHTNTIFALATTSDSKMLASASGDMLVKLWDLQSKTLLKDLVGHTDTVFALTFTSSNQILISGAGDYTIRIWYMNNLGTSDKIEAQTGMIESISLNDSETVLALGCRDKTVHLWDWATKKPLKKFLNHHTNVIKTVKFFPGSNVLMSASLDFNIHIWNADEERHDYSLKGHTFAIRCADITNDGSYLVSVANDLTIRVWDLKSIGELELVDVEGPLASFLYLTKIKQKISPSKINFNALFSPLKVNLAHIYAYLGYETLLAEALRLGTEVRIDEAEHSPLFYALERRTQGCVDVILEFITELHSKNFEVFLNYTYAIREDFEKLIGNRSVKLPEFLETIFYQVRDITNFAVAKVSLPHLHYSTHKILRPDHFVLPPEELNLRNDEIPVMFKTMPFPIPYQKGSSGSIKLLESISNCPNKLILRTEFVRVYIRDKWDNLWGYILILTALTWINIGLMIALVISSAKDDTTSLTYIGLVIAFFAVNSLLSLYEIIQMFSVGLSYFKEIWNLIDVARVGLCFAWIFLSIFQNNGYLRYVTWPMVLVNFFRGLTGFRAFDNTRYYTRLIVRAFFDSTAFLIVFFYSTLAFGMLYLASNPSTVSSISSIWSIPYELNMGNFDNANFDSLDYACFMVASIINVIIILNLLISILGDSFESFQAEAQEIDCLDMVDLVIELEKLASCRRSQNLKKYLQTCEDLVGEGKSNWEGRLKAIFASIEVAKKQSSEDFEVLNKRTLDIVEKLEAIDKKLAK